MPSPQEPPHDLPGHPIAGRSVVFLSWRDLRNPEGGGAELYLQQMASGLVRYGARVTIFTAAHPGASADEVVDGIRYVRRGSKMSVYLRGMQALALGRLGRPDIVVDIQNGIPFFTRAVTRRPVVLLIHHVHREQWPVVYPGPTGKGGWFIESRLSPWLYRTCQYVTVSRATRGELRHLGVAGTVAVVHNGTERQVTRGPGKTPEPSICVVGRLVPHKRVEHAMDAVAALREEIPGLRLTVVGDGWWGPDLRAYADRAGVSDLVEFTGHVDEDTKQSIYERSWVMALPSLKEGWGLVVGEAAMHRTPTVAYRAAGGTQESIDHDVSGVLVDTLPEFVEALRRVLTDPAERARLADGALAHSGGFTWEHSQRVFADILAANLRGVRVDAVD